MHRTRQDALPVRAIGPEPLVQLDVHLHREFIQENLGGDPAPSLPAAGQVPHADATAG